MTHSLRQLGRLECQCEGGKNWTCDFLTFVPLLDTADLRVRDPGKNALLKKNNLWLGSKG